MEEHGVSEDNAQVSYRRSDSIRTFQPVWFTTQQNLYSWFTRGAFSDQGFLEVFPQGFRFIGAQWQLVIGEVTSVSLTSSPVPWLTLVICNCFLVFALLLLKDDLVIIAMLLMTNLLCIASSRLRKWVHVEFVDENGRAEHAYFADGLLLLGGGKFGKLVQGLLLITILMGNAFGRAKNWIGMYANPADGQHRSEAEEGVQFGWGGMLGGTNRLHEIIKQYLRSQP